MMLQPTLPSLQRQDENDTIRGGKADSDRTPDVDNNRHESEATQENKGSDTVPDTITNVITDISPPATEPRLPVSTDFSEQVNNRVSPRRSERARKSNPRYNDEEYDLSVASTVQERAPRKSNGLLCGMGR